MSGDGFDPSFWDDADAIELPVDAPVAEDAWGICWLSNGKLYIPRTWETEREATRAFRDLMMPYDKTSEYYSQIGVVPCRRLIVKPENERDDSGG